ncbi:DUF3006 domain-containing protein [Caldicoprobacter algeriensis]|uniref:DUF3006 domain-containing protein n=1 Tax=Caldicoprobacter algeriensis TaxID=699281 RepID=UPI00207A9A97|nr:DUF3006 domain-containing protein [Caldicoprobacter algeriensis]MCM8900624.1 DUF3006 domain-containing protein [Caldicoprobacter algeriensis]
MKKKILVALVSIVAVAIVLLFVVFLKDDNNTSMKAAVDRFEGDYAVILVGEEEIPVNIPRKLLPKGVKPGISWLEFSLELDSKSEQKYGEKIGNLFEKLLR